jgi:hypothetical protein
MLPVGLGELVDPATRIEFKQIEFLDTTGLNSALRRSAI